MTSPDSDTNEQIILDSPSVSIKDIKFRVILTNYRIVLQNASTLKQNDISLSEVQKVKAEAGLTGDPILLLFILSKSGESKKMVLNFLPEREDERDHWITEMKRIIAIYEKEPAHGVEEPSANSDLLNQHPDNSFCSRCGNKVINGSLFCNRCGSKIMPPVQPTENSHDERKLTRTEEYPSKISVDKITLPPRKTQSTGPSHSYIKPKEVRSAPFDFETIKNKFKFPLPAISNQKQSITSLCCGGILLLVLISAVVSSLMQGSVTSDTGTNSLGSSPSSVVSSTTVKPSEPGDVLDLYLFTYQNVGATFPVKISGTMLYDYLSKNASSTTSREEVGIVVSSVRTQWRIFDYTIGKTEKRGKYATVTADIIWQTPSGIQVSRTKQISFVFEDNKWKLDEFFYSM